MTDMSHGPESVLEPVQPCASVGAGLRPVTKRWNQFRVRRGKILAAARAVMSEVGYEMTFLKSIAGRAGVSVPTIYNVVGNRAGVLDQASAEWVEWLFLGDRTAPPGPGTTDGLIRALGRVWMSAVDFPDYTQRGVETFLGKDRPLQQAYRGTGRRLAHRMLVDLARQGLLSDAVDLDALSWHLTEVVHAGVVRWTSDRYDAARYRAEFASGPGLLVIGALSLGERNRVEPFIQEWMRDLPRLY